MQYHDGISPRSAQQIFQHQISIGFAKFCPENSKSDYLYISEVCNKTLENFHFGVAST